MPLEGRAGLLQWLHLLAVWAARGVVAGGHWSALAAPRSSVDGLTLVAVVTGILSWCGRVSERKLCVSGTSDSDARGCHLLLEDVVVGLIGFE